MCYIVVVSITIIVNLICTMVIKNPEINFHIIKNLVTISIEIKKHGYQSPYNYIDAEKYGNRQS